MVCVCVALCVSMYKGVCMWLYSWESVCRSVDVYVSVWLNEFPDGYTWQADVSLRGLAEVDGVAVQADVLECVPDVVEISQVAECVLVHHLNIVTLEQELGRHIILNWFDLKFDH